MLYTGIFTVRSMGVCRSIAIAGAVRVYVRRLAAIIAAGKIMMVTAKNIGIEGIFNGGQASCRTADRGSRSIHVRIHVRLRIGACIVQIIGLYPYFHSIFVGTKVTLQPIALIRIACISRALYQIRISDLRTRP